MKILKLLNKKNLSIIIFSLLITSSPFAEDKPVDIWDIEKTQICLNLKLTKVICNLLKIQVQTKLISLL